MTDEQAGESEHSRARRVEALAREIADTINAGQIDAREGLRDIATDVLREAVRTDDIGPANEAAAGGPSHFNPFGIGIPLILMGSVMVFLFPPVGLFLFAVAAVVLAWGVAATLFAR